MTSKINQRDQYLGRAVGAERTVGTERTGVGQTGVLTTGVLTTGGLTTGVPTIGDGQ